MRSLWRMIAARWLGGHGSEALTGDSALLDLFIVGERERTPPAFEVSRRSEVSHQAMMSPRDGVEPGFEAAAEKPPRNRPSG